MSSSMNTILIIGATSGIGESFARRFHSMGKKVIITGRRQDRLAKLQSELPGVETVVMDNADLAGLPAKVAEITQRFPDLDTVWVNSGIQKKFSFTDPSTSTDASIAEEVTTNLTAPIILARLFVPFLLSRGPSTETNIMMTTSGLAYVPRGVDYPVYCPTKAAIHSFMVILRHQLQDTNVNVIEIAPPYVRTELDVGHRTTTFVTPMALDDFTNQVFDILNAGKASELKEVAVGFAARGVGAWRGSIGKILEAMGVTA